ncbi:MAG: sodium:calcium antiporter [Patescibacteria group bacterium]
MLLDKNVLYRNIIEICFNVRMSVFFAFFTGLVGLWLGAEFLTRAAVAISKRFGLSEGFIGLTILAIASDIPEIMVSVTGAIEQKMLGVQVSNIVIGNIIGSNMGQIGLIMGLVGLISAVGFKKKMMFSEGMMMLGSVVVFYLTALDGRISRVDGLIYLIFIAMYFFLTSRSYRLNKSVGKIKNGGVPWLPILGFFVGMGILVEASHLVLENGLDLVAKLGISQMVVGVLFVGLGTSLPELVIATTAALKGNRDLSLGNLVGCFIVDNMLALGLGAMISSWTVDRQVIEFDLPFLIFSVVVVMLFLLTKARLEKRESLLILGLYLTYVLLKVFGV